MPKIIIPPKFLKYLLERKKRVKYKQLTEHKKRIQKKSHDRNKEKSTNMTQTGKWQKTDK